MNKSKVTYFGAILAAFIILSGAATMPMLPAAEATTTVISSNTTLPATTVNAGDTLIVNPGVTVTLSGLLTNNGNVVNSGTIIVGTFQEIHNYGILLNLAGGTIRAGNDGAATLINYESGFVKDDAVANAATHYNRMNFDNYGTHISYAGFSLEAFQDFGVYRNFATGTFESFESPGISVLYNYGGLVTFHDGAHLKQDGNVGGGLLFTNGTINNYGLLSVANTFPGSYEIGVNGMLNNFEGAVIETSTRPSFGTLTNIVGTMNNDGKFNNKGDMNIRGTFNNNGILENNLNPIGGEQTAVIDISGTLNNGPDGTVTNFSLVNNLASGTIDNDGLITNKCDAEFNDSGTFTGNPVVEDCVAFPITHMSDMTATSGYGVHAPKPARAELATPSSQLVGDKIDSITLKLKRVGTISGTAEIGILDANNNIKKLFGTINVATLTTTYTDYEFHLTGGELYTIVSGDRIGIKYTGGDASNWVAVMLDLDAADPFDGTNSYHQYRQGSSWLSNTDRDMYMILKQTHA
ncbi:hypothetical protein [Candidatus Nitrososphaera sp. FF02]|uniref:hypothetical protein n=1 Tax=Candidatus Nitrososphaera sp. FF02 TaxID=3398226 RepID=UPI0039E902AC